MPVCLLVGIIIASASASQTIRVGSSTAALSKTIQGGVDRVPDGATTRWTIDIEPGVYNERVHVAKTKGPLMMRGLAPADSVVLIHACPGGAGNGKPGCTPCPPFNKTKPNPGMRADVTTMLVLSDDFTATNMTIANNACGYNAKGGAGQSDALQAMGDRHLFANCRILGGQDTLLTGAGSTRQYFYRSFINGSCDSIYGSSAAVFDQCTITVTDHITAQKPPETAGGPTYLIVNSSLRKPSKDEFDYPASKGRTELGRPWGDHAHVVYKNVYMDDHIATYGWGDWSHSCSTSGAKCSSDPTCWCQNVSYSEYNSTGPGAVPSARVKWSRQLTAAEAAQVTPAAVLRGWTPPLW
jgi:pectinesterase